MFLFLGQFFFVMNLGRQRQFSRWGLEVVLLFIVFFFIFRYVGFQVCGVEWVFGSWEEYFVEEVVLGVQWYFWFQCVLYYEEFEVW